MAGKFRKVALVVAACSMVLASAVAAETKTVAKHSSPAGSYRQGGVDSVGNLYVLPDNTFCYTMMAGSLDYVAAGRWTRDGDTISFKEVKGTRPSLVAFVGDEPDEDGRLLVHGHTMSDAEGTAIAFNDSATAPKTYRRLFPSGKHSWSSRYAVPDVPLTGEIYLHLLRDSNGRADWQDDSRELQYEHTVYRVRDEDRKVMIVFDKVQSMKPLEIEAQISPEGLISDGGQVMSRDDMDASEITIVQEKCINPALNLSGAQIDGRLQPVSMSKVTAEDVRILEEAVFPEGDEEPADVAIPAEDIPADAPPPPQLPELSIEEQEDASTEEFNAISEIENEYNRIAPYKALIRKYLGNPNLEMNEVALRSAVNLTEMLNGMGSFNESIAAGDAILALPVSDHPVIRSRVFSTWQNIGNAWEGKGDFAKEREVREKALAIYGLDGYPTTAYLAASARLATIDYMLTDGKFEEADFALKQFKDQFLDGRRLRNPPLDGLQFTCDSTSKRIPAVPCRAGKPNEKFIAAYYQAYVTKLKILRKGK